MNNSAHKSPVPKQPNSQAPQLPSFYTHPSSYVDEGAIIGDGTKIWHFSHIMKGAVVGKRCSFGQNVNVADSVTIGNNVKVQNNVSIYAGTIIEDDVFLGPSCVLTNVTNPRSQINRHSLYERTLIRRGASLGANCTVVCGVTIGRYAFIGAGAVVTKDVPDYALMVGTPARQKGWMSRHGHILKPPTANHTPPTKDHQPPTILTCPESGLRYQLTPSVSDQPQTTNHLLPNNPTINQLRCIDIDEDDPLPIELVTGSKTYDDLKK